MEFVVVIIVERVMKRIRNIWIFVLFEEGEEELVLLHFRFSFGVIVDVDNC